MNFNHSANSLKAGRRHYRHPSPSSALQKLWPFASRCLGLALATGSFLFAEPLPAATPLAWGDGRYGQLGDGNFYQNSYPRGMSTPVQVSGFTDAMALAGGGYHSLALNSDGTVWTWGYGYSGQLGDGNFYTSSPFGVVTPVRVRGLSSVVAIAGGVEHSLALNSDGTVWAWGYGYYGQLGDGNFHTTGNAGVAIPVQVSALTTVTAIACGDNYSLALSSDGTVWAWGRGYYGQLGDGNFYTTGNAGVATPVQVSGLTTVTAIAGGGEHSLALKSDGTVWAWGAGYFGQLGDGNFYTAGNGGVATPVQVSGLSAVVAIAGGGVHSLALKSDGTVWAWGYGTHGGLGDGNFYTSFPYGAAAPVQVTGLSGVVAIAGGAEHSLALKSDGTVWAWGWGRSGQLGDGNFYTTGNEGVATPVQVSGLTSVTAIAAGNEHSLALRAVAANAPSLNISLTPVSALNQVGTLHWLTATLTTDSPAAGTPVPNTLVTFKVISGPNVGQNGTGTTDASGAASFSYTGLGGVGVDVIRASFVDNQQGIPVSNSVTEEWVNPGTPLAWGDGFYGELGDGNFYSFFYGAPTPVQVSGFTGAVAIAGGGYHSLALKSDGTVWAWGRGYDGELGDGNFYTTGNRGVATPVQVSGLTTVTAIASGGSHSLALDSGGTVWDWGDGVATPVEVSGLTTVTAINSGVSHRLALKSDGTVWAWGVGSDGQLGDGIFYTSPPYGATTPVQVSGLTTVTAIAGGGAHSLALKSDGTVWAWGSGQYGQLGDGNFYTTGNQGVATPVQVTGLSHVTAIAGGGGHSLALKSDGTVWAWGNGANGQLGDGNFYRFGNEGVATPVQVTGLTDAVAIAGSFFYSLALKSDGTVWAWGAGTLGDGNFSSPGVATPIRACTLGQAVNAIAAGGFHSLALPAVAANKPFIACPCDLTVFPSQCSAVVNYPAPLVSGGIGNVVVICNPPAGAVFPLGITTVACTATDAAGSVALCSFNVTVYDTHPPVASCAVVKATVLLANPPRIVGWFQLLATDACDSDPLIYIRGSAGSFVAGPFHNGDQVEIAHGPSLIPGQSPSTSGGNIASIRVNGDALLWAVDSSGNTSTPVKCK